MLKRNDGTEHPSEQKTIQVNFMNGNRLIIPLCVLCLVLGFSDICPGKDQKSPLTVKRIDFAGDKTGGESIVLVCNQGCTPDVSAIEGNNPRVVMDLRGVSSVERQARDAGTKGKLVKRIRGNWDNKSKIYRVVLDMEPSKSYIVRPMQEPSGHFVLAVKEDKDSTQSKKRHITIQRPALKQVKQEGDLQTAASRAEKPSAVKTAEHIPLLDQGQTQLNEGDFAAAADTFTKILATNPKNSLIYRLRGDAYDNLGDEQKALEDWTKAARLGDTVIQSSLDAQGVQWRE
jgi:hypothetical protein